MQNQPQENKQKVFLANLGIEVPIYELDEEKSQVVIRVSDIPEHIAKSAYLTGKFARYWYGENAGGNRLVANQPQPAWEWEEEFKKTFSVSFIDPFLKSFICSTIATERVKWQEEARKKIIAEVRKYRFDEMGSNDFFHRDDVLAVLKSTAPPQEETK